MATGFKMGQNAIGNFKDFISGLEPLPQYQQQQGATLSDPGQFANAQQSGGFVNALNQQLGITAPQDIRESQYKSAFGNLDRALNAAGATGSRGGVAVGQGTRAVQDVFNPLAANIESQYAQNQMAANAMNQGAALNYGQAFSGFNLNRAAQANQMGQFNAGFGADQALQAYQINNLLPRQEDIALQQALADYQLGLAQAKMGRNAQLGGAAIDAAGSIIGGLVCWVAVELYGEASDKTQHARLWAMNNDNIFTRLYRKYGQRWAELVKTNKLARYVAKPIWDAMANAGERQLATVIG